MWVGGAWGAGEVGRSRWPGEAWWRKSLRRNLKGYSDGARAGTGLEGAECAQTSGLCVA